MIAVLAVLAVGMLVGCTRPGHPSGPPTGTPWGTRPVAVVEGGSVTQRLNGYGCWTDFLCIDPVPPHLGDWPAIGDADAATFTVALDTTGPLVTFYRVDVQPGTSAGRGTVTPVGPTSWRIDRPAEPGTYAAQVTVPNGANTLTYYFRWTVS